MSNQASSVIAPELQDLRLSNESMGIYVGQVKVDRPWKFIPNTKEELDKALNEGFNAKSMYLFSKEPIDGGDEVLRMGNLILDFDCEGSPISAIIEARNLVKALEKCFKISGTYFNYWLSGKKGCHMEIPSVVYGDIYGDPNLPLIHQAMAKILSSKICGKLKYLDENIYNMKRGRLIRIENIKREDGKYKVPITYDEFMNIDEEQIQQLTLKPRNIIKNQEIVQEYLEKKYYPLDWLYEIAYTTVKNKKIIITTPLTHYCLAISSSTVYSILIKYRKKK
jgi:hypothetical protein